MEVIYEHQSPRVAMSIEIDAPFFDEAFLHLSSRKLKVVARAACQGAGRVMKKTLKKQVRSIAKKEVYTNARKGRKNVQSTGTTWRSISIKAGVTRKGGAYVVVAPDTKYVERHVTNSSLYKAWAGRKGRNVGTTRRGGRAGIKFAYIKSFATRSIRKPLKRRPGKYWHLINNGFRHRGGTVFMGYRFTDRSMMVSEKAAKALFMQLWDNGVTRAMGIPVVRVNDGL